MAPYVEAVRLHRVVGIRRSGKRIVKIRVEEPNGKTKVWSVAEAIEAMVQGTDAFFVFPKKAPLWSPVTPFPYQNPKYIRTREDTTKKDILKKLPTF